MVSCIRVKSGSLEHEQNRLISTLMDTTMLFLITTTYLPNYSEEYHMRKKR